MAEAIEWPQPNSARGAPWATASQTSSPGLASARSSRIDVARHLPDVVALDAAAQAGHQRRAQRRGSGSARPVHVQRTVGVDRRPGACGRPPPPARRHRRRRGTSSCARRTSAGCRRGRPGSGRSPRAGRRGRGRTRRRRCGRGTTADRRPGPSASTRRGGRRGGGRGGGGVVDVGRAHRRRRYDLKLDSRSSPDSPECCRAPSLRQSGTSRPPALG